MRPCGVVRSWGADIMNVISSLIKGTPESSLSPPATWGPNQEMALWEAESELSPNTDLLSP